MFNADGMGIKILSKQWVSNEGSNFKKNLSFQNCTLAQNGKKNCWEMMSIKAIFISPCMPILG